MSDSESTPFERGAAKFREVYGGDVVEVPEGTLEFNDVMMRTLFAQVWDRDVLSLRDRRLLVMGATAAFGSVEPWKIQARAALKNTEITPDQLRETLIMLAPYAGYPNVAQLVVPCEDVIRTWLQDENT